MEHWKKFKNTVRLWAYFVGQQYVGIFSGLKFNGVRLLAGLIGFILNLINLGATSASSVFQLIGLTAIALMEMTVGKQEKETTEESSNDLVV